MLKNVRPQQVEYLPLERLTVGMVTPDGVILAVDFDTRTYRVPLSLLELDPGRAVAVLCRIDADMVAATREAAEARAAAATDWGIR